MGARFKFCCSQLFIHRNEAEKEAEKAAVVAAAQGHFLEQTNSNYNYGEETVLNNNDEDEYQEENLNPKTNTKRSRSKKGKSKYGYKYDGFINDSEEMDSADEDWEDQEPKPKKKNIRGRPKKIKEENVDKLNDEDDLNQIDPMVKVKEEAIERAFNELNEFFNPEANILQAVPVTFNQDDSGVFNCEAPNCIFSTMVGTFPKLFSCNLCNFDPRSGQPCSSTCDRPMEAAVTWSPVTRARGVVRAGPASSTSRNTWTARSASWARSCPMSVRTAEKVRL